MVETLNNTDREIVVSRVLSAPRELVFEMWARPEHVAQWFGPRGFSITTHEMNFQVGGVWRFMMHSPDGSDYPNKVTYTAIEPVERIEYDQGWDEKPPMFHTVVSLADAGAKTEITLRMIFPTAEACAETRRFGAVEGGFETLERLEERVANFGDCNRMSVSTPSDNEIVITRSFDAPRELVFNVWTKPEHIQRWMLGPPGWSMPVCEVDLRSGGVWHFVWRNHDGEEMPMHWEYGEVVPPARFVYTERWGGDMPDTLNTVEFSAENGKTLMSHTMHFASKATRDDAMETGTESCMEPIFARIAEVLKSLK